MRGMGRIFKRRSVYWIAYYHRGKEHRESSHSESEKEARRLLKRRIGEVGTGRFTGPREERVTFEDLAKALLTDYEINRRRSVRSARLSISHLREFFGLERAVDITTDRIKAYASARQREGAANASINRELAALKRMFSLAVQDGRLSNAPYIPSLEEDNARQGFLDHAAFVALIANLPEYLQDPIAFLYLSGWRLGEMKALEWRDIDLAGKVVHLRPEISKNKDGRLLPLSGELLEIVARAHAKRRLDCPFVFQRDGEPDRRLSQGMVERAQGGALGTRPRARPPAHRRAQHGARRHSGSSSDDSIGSQDAQHLRQIQHRERGGSRPSCRASSGASRFATEPAKGHADGGLSKG